MRRTAPARHAGGTLYLPAAPPNGECETLARVQDLCLAQGWGGSHLLAWVAPGHARRLARRVANGASLKVAWGIYLCGRLAELDRDGGAASERRAAPILALSARATPARSARPGGSHGPSRGGVARWGASSDRGWMRRRPIWRWRGSRVPLGMPWPGRSAGVSWRLHTHAGRKRVPQRSTSANSTIGSSPMVQYPSPWRYAAVSGSPSSKRPGARLWTVPAVPRFRGASHLPIRLAGPETRRAVRLHHRLRAGALKALG